MYLTNRLLWPLIMFSTGCVSEPPVGAVLDETLVLAPFDLESARPKNKWTVEDQDKVRPAARVDQCRKKLAEVSTALRELAQYAKIPDSSADPYRQVMGMGPGSCEPHSYHDTLSILSSSLKVHTGRVGLILDRDNVPKNREDALVAGLAAALSDYGNQGQGMELFEIRAVTRHTRFLQRFADLVLREKVAMVIADVRPESREALLKYSKQLALPVILLQSKPDQIEDNPYAFWVYPSIHQIVQRLVREARTRNFRSVAILQPSNRSGRLGSMFRTALREANIRASKLSYVPGQLASMSRAVERISGLHDPKRIAAHKAQLQRLASTGDPIPPAERLLPAQLQADAVFIPDGLRSLKHFVDLFKYHGVSTVPLLGTFEWRARELLVPWDPFLKGAVFVDFVSSYNRLPRKLRSGIRARYFTSFERAQQLDDRILGYRSGSVALSALDHRGVGRFKLNKAMEGYKPRHPVFKGQTFDAKGVISWPTFVFQVQDKRLAEL